MKVSSVTTALALTGAAAASTNLGIDLGVGIGISIYPTTTIAGVEVINTKLVQAARALIEVFEDKQPYLVKHLYRTWLFGAAAINANATLKASIDLELHAVGTLLHDLGWDMRPNSPWVTSNQRFEVDSGHGAVNFVKANQGLLDPLLDPWDDVRLERLYDGISLQVENSIITGKNLQTQWIVNSVNFEYPGPRPPMIPENDWNNILAAYPNHYLYRGTNQTFTFIAESKPEGTYNTFIQEFGTHYVPGYSVNGHLLFELLTGAVAAETAQYPNAVFTD